MSSISRLLPNCSSIDMFLSFILLWSDQLLICEDLSTTHPVVST